MGQFRCNQQVPVESNSFPSVGSFTNGSLANIQHFFSVQMSNKRSTGQISY